MNTFKYEVRLVVEVDAFDQSDADFMVEEAFSLGENCGTRIVDSEVIFEHPKS